MCRGNEEVSIILDYDTMKIYNKCKYLGSVILIGKKTLMTSISRAGWRWKISRLNLST